MGPIIFVAIMTLVFGGITFGVLTSLWGKGMVEFVWFIAVVAFATYCAQLAWGAVL